MNSRLLKGLPEKDQKEFQQLVKHNVGIKRLVEYLQQDLKQLQADNLKGDQFSNPSWPFLQA